MQTIGFKDNAPLRSDTFIFRPPFLRLSPVTKCSRFIVLRWLQSSNVAICRLVLGSNHLSRWVLHHCTYLISPRTRMLMNVINHVDTRVTPETPAEYCSVVTMVNLKRGTKQYYEADEATCSVRGVVWGWKRRTRRARTTVVQIVDCLHAAPPRKAHAAVHRTSTNLALR